MSHKANDLLAEQEREAREEREIEWTKHEKLQADAEDARKSELEALERDEY